LNFLIFPGLIFWIVGQQFNDQVIVFQGFFICYFFLIPLMMSNDAIVESQIGFLEGKWEIKTTELSNNPQPRHSLWRRMALKVILMGLIPAAFSYLALWIYVWVSGSSILPLDPWTSHFLAAFIALIPTWIISHVWIKRYLAPDLSDFANSPKQSEPEPSLRYFFWEHALPWSIILVILNVLINLKGFTENYYTELPYEITVGDLSWSVGITLFIVMLWMGASAMNQVRGDIHLGRVKSGKRVAIWILVVLFFGITALGYFLVHILGAIFSVTTFSIAFSTIIVVIVSVISGLLGRIFGIILGVSLTDTGFFKNKPNE